MILEVITGDAHGGESAPMKFKLGITSLAVREIIDRWPGDTYSYFKVRADDDAIYILRHDKLSDEWELTLFNRYGD